MSDNSEKEPIEKAVSSDSVYANINLGGLAHTVSPEEKQRDEELRLKAIADCKFKPGEGVVLAVDLPDNFITRMVVGRIAYDEYSPAGEKVAVECFYYDQKGRVCHVWVHPAALRHCIPPIS